MPSTLRLGTCSPATQPTTPLTLALLARLAARAARQHIDLLLLPEAFVGGYPRGAAFGSVVGNRTAAGRDDFLRYFRTAVDLGDTVNEGAGAGDRWVRRELPGDVLDGEAGGRRGDCTREELERIAAESGVFLVVGVVERAGGSLYCGVVYVCPKMGCVGKRRKVQPTGTERLCWAAGSPATLRAVSTRIRGVRVNMAAAVCWESYMPLLRQALYAQNINLYLAPTADGRDAWLSLMRTVGAEGRCFVLSANMCVREAAVRGGDGDPAVLDGEEEGEGVEPLPLAGRRGGRKPSRRRSVNIGHGMEIALPRSPSPKTVLGEEGGEVEPTYGDVVAEDTEGLHGEREMEESPSAARSKSASTRQRRKKSIIDENGNQIVLACYESSEETEEPAALNGTKKASSAMNSNTELRARGGSNIVGPFGDVLAGPQWDDDEGIIFADVDFDDCIRGRLDLDVGGSYARNDSFHFSVDGLDLSPLPYL